MQREVEQYKAFVTESPDIRYSIESAFYVYLTSVEPSTTVYQCESLDEARQWAVREAKQRKIRAYDCTMFTFRCMC